MTRYLFSFPSVAMDHIPAGQGHGGRRRRDGHRASAARGSGDGDGRDETDRAPVDLVWIEPASDGGLGASWLPSAMSTSCTSTGPPVTSWRSHEHGQKMRSFDSTSVRDPRGAETCSMPADTRSRSRSAPGTPMRSATSVGWDGKWSGRDAMWDNLRVEPPRKVR